MQINELLKQLFVKNLNLMNNFAVLDETTEIINQAQTNKVFSEKWLKMDDRKGLKPIENFQKDWYLELYGFKTEVDLASFLKDKKNILDAGCGLGYKAAWFAELSPNSLVIGMDFSDAVKSAATNYSNINNLVFIKGDIADTQLFSHTIDFISCDQVIHHTEMPDETFGHLCDKLKHNGEFACYVYAKKALPRELLDDYFREYSKKLSNTELWQLSEQLTVLGRQLSELQIQIDVPDIPSLQIKGGVYDLQRFIYWNFMKCFWNKEFGFETSVETNFDWYAPSNAKRYSEVEYKSLIKKNNLSIEYFHSEEACYSGRFKRSN